MQGLLGLGSRSSTSSFPHGPLVKIKSSNDSISGWKELQSHIAEGMGAGMGGAFGRFCNIPQWAKSTFKHTETRMKLSKDDVNKRKTACA